MTGRLQGKRCLVTGGSRGLGRAIALAFAREGARIAFTFAHQPPDAADAAARLREAGCEPLVFRGSVTDARHVVDTVAAVVRTWGGLDILVNGAQQNQILPLALLEEEDWDALVDVNVKGAFLYARAAARHMIRARGGKILNLGSFSSERVIDAPVHYAASMSALRGLTEALAREVGRYGVQVNLLAPGLVEGGLASALPEHRVREYLSQCPLGRFGTAEELARMAVFLVSDENTFMTGAKLVADGGL